MPKIKHKRFQQVAEFDHVIEWTSYPHGEGFQKDIWRTSIFKNDQPLVLELACGKAEYTTGLAERNPQYNYIGVDIKGNRLWVGAQKAIDLSLTNAAFLRAYIGHLDHYIEDHTVQDIWIVFPDPQLKKDRKKLTATRFLDLYKRLLIPGGRVHLKTDSPELFEFTIEQLKAHNLKEVYISENIYSQDVNTVPDQVGPVGLREIQTYYEKMHLKKGRIIRCISFSF